MSVVFAPSRANELFLFVFYRGKRMWRKYSITF